MNEFYNKMKYFVDTEKVNKEIFYHYTSLDALFNIVKTRTIRLTSLTSSNDLKELKYNSKELLNDLNTIFSSETNVIFKDFVSWIIKSVETNKDKYNQECKIDNQSYSLCLSNKKDNLTHWDRYAQNCTGVCICFNTASLVVLLKRNVCELVGAGLLTISKVIYNKETRNSQIKMYLSRILKILLEDKKKTKDELKDMVENVGYRYAVSVFNLISVVTKNSHFIEEDELRIYHSHSSIKANLKLLDELKFGLKDIQYKNLRKNYLNLVSKTEIENENYFISKNGIRAYKNLNLSEIWGSGVIEEIILGPLCNQNKKELQRFLKNNGLEGVKVTVSKVPIR